VIVHADVDRGQGFVADGRLDALGTNSLLTIARRRAEAAVLPAVTRISAFDELTARIRCR